MKYDKIFLEAKLQSKYINETINSLTSDELLSIQKSNDDLKNWSFPIATELIRRTIPIVAMVAVGQIILEAIQK